MQRRGGGHLPQQRRHGIGDAASLVGPPHATASPLVRRGAELLELHQHQWAGVPAGLAATSLSTPAPRSQPRTATDTSCGLVVRVQFHLEGQTLRAAGGQEGRLHG